MKKSILSIFSIVATLFAVLLLSLSAAGGEIIVSAEADEGKSLSSLDAGDIVHVTVVLPKVENTSKLQLDLIFNDSVFEYNRDADASEILSSLTIGKVEAVEDNIVRLVAAGLSSASFEPETVALSASFTVKQDVSSGEKDAFSLAGLKCADESVLLMADSVKIKISGSIQAPTEVTTADETTAPPEVTTAEVTTAPSKVTTAAETTSAPEITTAETTIHEESDDTKDSVAETTLSQVTTTESSVELTDEIDTVITTVKSPEPSDSDNVDATDEVSGKESDDGVPIVIPTMIVLVIACALALIIAFLFSKHIKLPK